MLTKKEIEVLELKKKNLTQIKISSRLKISQPAVTGFYRNALKKIRESKEVNKIIDEIFGSFDDIEKKEDKKT